MNSASSSNDKSTNDLDSNHHSGGNNNNNHGSGNVKRNPKPDDDFNGVHYNKMVDESKHTEEVDLSYAET